MIVSGLPKQERIVNSISDICREGEILVPRAVKSGLASGPNRGRMGLLRLRGGVLRSPWPLRRRGRYLGRPEPRPISGLFRQPLKPRSLSRHMAGLKLKAHVFKTAYSRSLDVYEDLLVDSPLRHIWDVLPVVLQQMAGLPIAEKVEQREVNTAVALLVAGDKFLHLLD